MDYVGGRVDPLAGVIQVRVGADGTNDGVGGDFHAGCLLDERLEGDANRGAAAVEKPGGMGVAVNGGVVRDVVIPCDVFRAVPTEEFLLDGVTVGVIADAAFPRVPAERRDGERRLGSLSLFVQPLRKGVFKG
jgi:hypothetical protein